MSNTTVASPATITTVATMTTTMMTYRSTTSKPPVFLLRRASIDTLKTTPNTLLRDHFDFGCPPNRWGTACKNICKPCGLGMCHPISGICICPEDMYGEYCDLWKGIY